VLHSVVDGHGGEGQAKDEAGEVLGGKPGGRGGDVEILGGGWS
jgi:hypothetical protein